MMPGKDGIEVCRELREKKATPVIMLTAKGEEVNSVQGFEVGTDDYIVSHLVHVKLFFVLKHCFVVLQKQIIIQTET